MDKLAERVGLYDIWAVFFPGIVGTLENLLCIGALCIIFSDGVFLKMLAFIPNTISEWIVAVVSSVFLGLIYQEIGRLLRKVFKIKNVGKDPFNPKTGLFEENEIVLLKRVLYKKDWNEQNAFHRINAEAQEKGIASKYVKLSVIQNMSLSLAAVLFVGTAESVTVMVLSALNEAKDMMTASIIVTVLCIFLIVMFIKRSERFNSYWVKNLIYAVAVSRAEEKTNGCEKPHEEN